MSFYSHGDITMGSTLAAYCKKFQGNLKGVKQYREHGKMRPTALLMPRVWQRVFEVFRFR